MIDSTQTLPRDLGYLFADAVSKKYFLRKYIERPYLHLISGVAYRLGRWIPDHLTTLDRPIFVIGCSRSGTTVLAEYFGQHGEVANWSEAAQLFDLDYYNPDIEHYKDETSITEPDAFRIKFLASMYTRLRGRKRFMNKHPQNSLRIRYLKALFPDALFVHLIRDGRAVVLSSVVKTKQERYRHAYPLGNFPKPIGWRNYRSESIHAQYARQWKEIIEHVRQTASQVLSPQDYIEVSYETFCADTHSVLRNLDQFCGLNPAARDYTNIPAQLRSQNDKWKTSLDATQIREIERIMGDCLTTFGYALTSAVAPPTEELPSVEPAHAGASLGAVS